MEELTSILRACDLIPRFHVFGSRFAVVDEWDVAASNVNEIGDVVMDGNEAVKRQR